MGNKVSKRLERLLRSNWNDDVDKIFPISNKTKRQQKAEYVYAELVSYFENNRELFREFKFNAGKLTCFLSYDFRSNDFPQNNPLFKDLSEEDKQLFRYALDITVNQDDQCFELTVKGVEMLPECNREDVIDNIMSINRSIRSGKLYVDGNNVVFTTRIAFDIESKESIVPLLDQQLPRIMGYSHNFFTEFVVHLDMLNVFNAISSNSFKDSHSLLQKTMLRNNYFGKSYDESYKSDEIDELLSFGNEKTKLEEARAVFAEIKEYISDNHQYLNGLFSDSTLTAVIRYEFDRKTNTAMINIEPQDELVCILINTDIKASKENECRTLRLLNNLNSRMETGRFLMVGKDNSIFFSIGYHYIGKGENTRIFDKYLSQAIGNHCTHIDKLKSVLRVTD